MVLLVGAYTIDMNENAPGKARGISAYDFSPTTGQLSFRGYVPTTNPSYLWVDDARKMVYAVRECPHSADPAVVAFRVARQADRRITFTPAGESLLHGDHPCHLVGIDDTLIVSSYSSGTVDVFAKSPEGTPGELLQHIALRLAGTNEQPHAHCAAYDPRRQRVYICDLGGDRLRVFARQAGGQLTVLPDHGINFQDGAGPRHIALHPGGEFAVVVCELRGVCVLIDLREDRPRIIQEALYLPERVVDQASGAAVRMDASGKHVYVSDRNFSVVTAMRLDVRAGSLTVRDTYPSGGQRPRDISVTPDGQWLLTGNLKDHSIGVFRRGTGGGLQLHHVVKKVPSPTCLKWMTL
ncbi:6-phosphogluconolactonase [Neolewinella maritima]|uniref:6-phosphogluconolactonase n=1 Tax=Neolewinella maritima TaxID=1383882 RepID=A0ABM9AZA7_9BACT|nr:beta-propeller fold lactonase family protein [Neolewinella maritima]CAH0999675.1 6-phosphogluconolactonase [Neolewinella maritima]